MTDFARMRRLRRLAVVPRWTVIPTIRRQSVAEHSFHVMWIARHVVDTYNAYKSDDDVYIAADNIMVAALLHDEAEALSGDIATPYKQGAIGEEIKNAEERHGFGLPLSAAEKTLLKLADLIEAHLFVCEERMLGNQGLFQVHDDLLKNFFGTWAQIPVFRKAKVLLAKDWLDHFVWQMQLEHPTMEYAREERHQQNGTRARLQDRLASNGGAESCANRSPATELHPDNR